MRAFIAIELPQQILKAVASAQARFRAACLDARWTRPEGIHLTLKFLGEISESKTQAVIEALNGFGGFDPFSVEVTGFGFFPNARRPRVFWAGVKASPDLEQLAAKVDSAMSRLGFPAEGRSFTPHLTLARLNVTKPRPELDALQRESPAGSFGSFEVREFYLWESRISPAGSTYRKVAKFEGSSGAGQRTGDIE